MDQRPDLCSRCGAPTVVPVVYGYPEDELFKAAARCEVVLGGCVFTGTQLWACLVCDYRWPLPPESLDSDLVEAALQLAWQAPESDRRHAVDVAHLLWEEGYGDAAVAAALTQVVPPADCAELGAEVAALVEALHEDLSITDFEKRRLALRARVSAAGHRAVAIYAAGRLAELRRLRASYTEVGDAFAAPYEVSGETLLNSFDRDLRMIDRAAVTPAFRAPISGELEDLRRQRGEARRSRRRAFSGQ